MKETSPRFGALIEAFKKLTGNPAILTTSFNSKAEPSAITSFLTTDLDHLVVGDVVASKKDPSPEDWHSLRISLPPYVRLNKTRMFVDPQQMATSFEVRTTYDAGFSFPVSDVLFDLLMSLEGEKPLGELLQEGGVEPAGQEALLAELDQLWFERLVRLRGGHAA